MKMSLRFAVLVLAIAAQACSSIPLTNRGRTAPSYPGWYNVSQLSPGTTIHVERRNDFPLAGKFVSADDEHLTLSMSGVNQTYAKTDIWMVTRRGNRVGDRMLTGAILGGLTGYVLSAIFGNALGFTTAGAASGAAGGVIPGLMESKDVIVYRGLDIR